MQSEFQGLTDKPIRLEWARIQGSTDGAVNPRIAVAVGLLGSDRTVSCNQEALLATYIKNPGYVNKVLKGVSAAAALVGDSHK